MENSKTKNVSPILLTLIVVSVSFMLISNILANRMSQLGFWSFDSGALTFPVTYIISDILSEVYGYKWSRRVAWMAAAMNLIFATFIFISGLLPYPEWAGTNYFDPALQTSFRIVAASILSYVMGDWVNDIIFRDMKDRKHATDRAGFKLRAILSSVGGALVDTSTFVFIAFSFTMPWEEMTPMILLGVASKIIYEIIILPVTIVVMRIVDKKESAYN